MRQIMDRAAFDQITTTCMRTYLAMQSSNLLAEETSRLRALTDRLLRAAGIAYLNESLPGLPSQLAGAPAATEYAEAFAEVQHLSAELQGELSRFPARKIESGDLVSAAALMQAWSEAPPGLPPLDALVYEAKEHFKNREWLQGRALLRDFLTSESILLVYARGYPDEAFPSPYLVNQVVFSAFLHEFPDFARSFDRKYGPGTINNQRTADGCWYHFMEWRGSITKKAL